MSLTILISAGEPSGDLYAGALVRELRRLEPAVSAFGMGGSHLRAAGADVLCDYTGLAVTGLTEAVATFGRSYAAYRTLARAARARRPAVFVPIDFPDFNVRLAARLKRQGIPIAYYISPQVWAWRRGRIRTLRRLADRMLVIFPFEEEMYRKAGVPVEFVGHPLLELICPAQSRRDFRTEIGVSNDTPLIALLPGSRASEVRHLLPVLLDAADRLRALKPAAFVVARAPGLGDALFTGARARSFQVVEGRTHDALAAADLAIVASGTATVEAAILGTPMVVVYRLGATTYRLGKPFVSVSTYAMVNLVAGRRIVPELIQAHFTPETVAREAGAILADTSRRERMRADLADVVRRLGTPGASERAARVVLACAGARVRGASC